MLSDADIERWSRQILLPEVGGRGQERLMAARVALLGDGGLATRCADLLRRAGVPLHPGVARADARLFVDLTDDPSAAADLARRALAAGAPLVRGRLAGAAGSVRTLIGRPCGLCAARDPEATAADALAAPAGMALAGLVAAEVLTALLVPPPHGRIQRFDLARGDFHGRALDEPGCEACGGRA
jgi:adenylyltransferase/sulfurtransferase